MKCTGSCSQCQTLFQSLGVTGNGSPFLLTEQKPIRCLDRTLCLLQLFVFLKENEYFLKIRKEAIASLTSASTIRIATGK